MLEFFIGGARSGKSRLAEQAAQTVADQQDKSLLYIATATAGDQEMADRIQHHQQHRGSHWQLIEEPIKLADTLQQQASENLCIVVDCLTLWTTNLLLAEDPQLFETEKQKLLDTVQQLPGHIIFISNEVGHGVIPADPLSRKFVDEIGFLHQQLATLCDKVHFVVAGIAQQLK